MKTERILPETGFTQQAFSRIDLVLVLSITTVLLVVALTSLAGSRQQGQSAACMNNLRQLGAALLMYSAENDGCFPPRTTQNAWPERLRRYYKDLDVLRCPSEQGTPATYPWETAPRSYIVNGWNDYFREMLPPTEWSNFRLYLATNSMAEKEIPLPAETIIFGEKYTFSEHLYMDLLTDSVGNDLTDTDPAHHFRDSEEPTSGGSNYAFADGSVRYLPFGQAMYPSNLWVTIPAWRSTYFPP